MICAYGLNESLAFSRTLPASYDLPPIIVPTYYRNTYAAEKKAALDLWAAHLKVAIAQPTGKRDGHPQSVSWSLLNAVASSAFGVKRTS